MEKIFNEISVNSDFFVLMFIRITALIFSSPIFGRKNIPNILKICLCILLAYIVFSASPKTFEIQYRNVLEFAIICIKELLFGLVLGYVTTLFFTLVQTSGQAMDMQMGFGMVNVFDVQDNISIPITGNLLYVVLLIIFFAVNGHHQLIYILQSTFNQIPVGTVALNAKIAWIALEVFVLAFLLAINVAMPIIASGLLGEVALGFMVRSVPQMNVFVVGIPLKILLGFLMLLLILPVYVHFTDVIFKEMFAAINRMVSGLAGVS